MTPQRKKAKLDDLLILPLAQRIHAVAEDVRLRRDAYSEIPAHELAEALGVPQPYQPDGKWSFTSYAKKISLEEYAEYVSPVSEAVYKLEGKVSEARFKALQESFDALDSDPHPGFEFLTPEEREALEEVITEEQLETNSMNGMCCLAHYSIKSKSEDDLTFEAVVEDDGTCSDLRTPYDERKGRFEDLSDCIEDSW